MAITLPTSVNKIVNRQKASVQNALPQSNPFLKNGLLNALIQSSSYEYYDMYQFLDTIQNGLFLDNYADTSVLDFWGELVGLSLAQPTASTGNVVFSGSTSGITIPVNTILSNGSLNYTTLSDGTLSQNSSTISQITQIGGVATIVFNGSHGLASGVQITISGADQSNYNGTKTVTVISDITVTFLVSENTTSPATGDITSLYYTTSISVQSVDNGSNTNLSSGATLSLQSPITSVNDNAYVDLNGLTGGTDTETEDNYKARIADEWANPVTNFNITSISKQAKAVDSVTRVFVLRATDGLINSNYNSNQSGFVTIYCVKDDADSIITTSVDNANIKTSIMSIAPMDVATINVNVLSLIAVPVDFTFSSITPDTTTMRTAIQENIREFFRGSNGVNGIETGEESAGNISLNNINLAILQTVDTTTGQSLESYSLTSPTADIIINDGEIATQGTITFL